MAVAAAATAGASVIERAAAEVGMNAVAVASGAPPRSFVWGGGGGFMGTQTNLPSKVKIHFFLGF